jgi:hypothetical protein
MSSWLQPSGSSTSRSTKKKPRRGSRVGGALKRLPGDFARNVEDIVTGLPAGLFYSGRAVGKAAAGDTKDLQQLAKAVGQGTVEDIRHPLRNPANTLLLLLAVPSGGSALAGRTAGAMGKAAQAEKILRPTRRMQIPKSVRQEFAREGPTKVIRGPRGKPQLVPTKKLAPASVAVPANPNPLIRGLRRATYDPIYKRSATKDGWLARKQSTRELANRERYTRQYQAGMKATDQYKPPAPSEISGLREVLGGPMNALRLTMYARLRYYLQNIGGTGGFFLPTEYGVLGTLKGARNVKNIRKTDPNLYRSLKAATGETGMSSLAIEKAGPLSAKVQFASHWANKPEAVLRAIAVERELQRIGAKTPAQMKKVLSDPSSSRAQLVMRRANEAVVDYARLSPWERAVMKSQIPIFYPMTKGFSRHAARYPTQHSVQSAMFSQLGARGQEQRIEALGGRPPWWAPYIIPTGKVPNQGTARLLNPQNTYTFSPGMDVARQAAQMFTPSGPVGGLNLLQNVGPMGSIVNAAVTGRDLGTGWPYRDEEMDYGSLVAALNEESRSLIPFGSILGVGQKARTYEPMTFKERLAMDTLGQTFFPRRVKVKELRRQIKGEASKKKRDAEKRRKRRNKSKGGGVPAPSWLDPSG